LVRTAGTGALDVDAVTSDLTKIHGTALTESVSGYLAAAFKKFYDVASPVFTAASVDQTGDAYANQPTNFGDLAVAVTTGEVEANLTKIKTDATSVTDLKDLVDTGYNPVTHSIDLVDQCTLNDDMVGTNSAALASNTALEATVAALNDFDAANDDVAVVTLVTTTTTNTDMVTEPPTAVQNRQEMDSNSTQLIAIVADTNELQTDDVPGLIGALKDFDPANDDVAVVTLVTTTTTNTDLTATDAAIADVYVDTQRMDALIEDSTGDRLTEKALEEAPSGTGGDATAANQVLIIAGVDALPLINEFIDTDTTLSSPVDGSVAQLSKRDINGQIIYEYPVTEDDDVTVIPNATVTVYPTSALAVALDQQVSNALGIATFHLEAGTYYFVTLKDNFTFDNPDEQIVA